MAQAAQKPPTAPATVPPPPGPPGPSQMDWDAATPLSTGAPPAQGPPAPAQVTLNQKPLPDLIGMPPPPGQLRLPNQPGSAPDIPGLLTTGLELAGMMGGPASIAKAVSQLPKAMRLGAKVAAAGFGGEAGSLVGNTLVTPAPDLPTLATRVGTAGVQGMAGEGIGAAIGKVASKAAAPFASRLTTRGRETIEALEGHVTPTQVVDSQSLNVIENVLEGSIFGGGRYRHFLEQQSNILNRRAEEILGQFGGRTEPGAAGQMYQDLLGAAHTAKKEAGGELFKEVDRLAAGKTVSLAPLKQFVEEETARRGVLGESLAPGQVRSTLGKVESAAAPDAAKAELGAWVATSGSAARQGLETALSNVGLTADDLIAGQMTFRQAQAVSSELKRMVRDADRTGNSQLRGIATQLLARTEGAMTTAAGGAGTPLRTALDTANKAWKTMADTFERGLLRKAAKVEPQKVMQTIIQPGRTDEIVKARQTIGVESWKPIQAQHTQSVLFNPDGTLRTGKQIETILGELTRPTLQAIYPRGLDQGLWQMSRILTQLQGKKRIGGAGRVAIQLAQGSAALGILTFRGDPTTAGAVLLGPAVISRAMLNPTVRQWLTTGLVATAKGETRVASRMAGQLLAWAGKEGLLESAGPPAGTAVAPPGVGPGPGAKVLGSPVPLGPPPGPPR